MALNGALTSRKEPGYHESVLSGTEVCGNSISLKLEPKES
jgi:hypothetical protein